MSANILREKGYVDEADKVMKQYNNHDKIVREYLSGIRDGSIPGRDLGDHEPLSKWVTKTYDTIESLLGKKLMNVLHLNHIKIINYAVPVVFDPCNQNWDMLEYQKHFVPLSGVVVFWGVWGVCILGNTSAFYIGAISCLAVSEKSRIEVEQNVSPLLSDVVYFSSNCDNKQCH